MNHPAFNQLCDLCETRGLHVGITTHHTMVKTPRKDSYRQWREITITPHGTNTVSRRATLDDRTLDQAATSLLAKVSP